MVSQSGAALDVVYQIKGGPHILPVTYSQSTGNPATLLRV